MDQDELTQIAEFIWRGGLEPLPDEDAWEKIMTVSLPHHMRVRTCHHQYVAKTHG